MSKRDPLAPVEPPAPSREDSREIVDAIVEAVRLLADPNASMNDIAARAGVGVASVYRYFPSRGAIYAEVSRRLHREFLASLRSELAAPHADLAAAVRAVCRIAVHVDGTNPQLRHALNVMVPASWSYDSACETFRTSIEEIVAWLRHHMPTPPADLESRVFVMFALARGTIQIAMSYPTLAPSMPDLVDHLTRATLAVLQP
jgi:AcrR family transcriptional regulator